MTARWTKITDRTATAAYRAAVTAACCFAAMVLYDVWMDTSLLPRLPDYRIAEWDRMAWGVEALIALAGLRWTVRGARGYGKGEPT